MAKSKFDKVVENLKDALNEAKVKLEKLDGNDNANQVSDLLDAVEVLLSSDCLVPESDYEDYRASETYYESGCTWDPNQE